MNISRGTLIRIPEKIQVEKIDQRFPTTMQGPFDYGASILNASGAPFDSFMFLETARGGKLLLALQMKHWKTNIKEEEMNTEFEKMKSSVTKNLPGTDFVGILLSTGNGSLNAAQLPENCIVISKNQHSSFYGKALSRRISIH